MQTRCLARSLSALGLLVMVLLAGCAPLEKIRQPAAPPPDIAAAAALLQRRDLAGAAAKLDAAIRKNPKDPASYLQAAGVCREYRQWDMAARYLEQGKQATRGADATTRAMLQTMLGEAYMEMKERESAVAAYREARDLMPQEPSALNNLGYAYAEAGMKLDEALALTQKAVAMAREKGADEQEIGIYMDSLGWVQYKRDSLNDAVATLARAAEMAPGQKEIHFHLALACRKAKRIPEAVVHLERALKIDPQYEEARQVLNSLKTAAPAPPLPGSALQP